MKAIVDCGAFKGTILKLFQTHKEYSSFDTFYAFECHPDIQKDYGQNVTVIEKAVWVSDKKHSFYVDPERCTSQGHSVFEDKVTGNLDTEKPLTVDCIDFSKWLSETFSQNDYVVVKMNIEGAEYPVLQKCIEDGSINLINELYIRWHQHKIPHISIEEHNSLKKKLFESDIKIYEDYTRLKIGNSEKGILLVAFGEGYDNLAAHTMVHSRKFTDLPICVLSNIRRRSKKWCEVKNVYFIYFDEETDNNRAIKTQMDRYTPFDKTIYIDCDSIIQNFGIDDLFKLINNDNLLLCKFPHKNFTSLATRYKDMLDLLKIENTIPIYFGAFLGFSRNGKVSEFFNMWNSHWKLSGNGREMPALASSVYLSGIDVEILPKDVFLWRNFNPNGIIKHEYGTYVRDLVGYRDFEHNKPFDIGVIRETIDQTRKRTKEIYFDKIIPEIVQIELTTACNAKCNYCRRQKVNSLCIEHMDFNLFKKIIDQVPRSAIIKISGAGEPTLYPYFYKALEYIKSKNKKIWVITNGSNLKGKVLKAVLNFANNIDISIDDYDKEIYENIRGLSFDNLKDNVINLMKKKSDKLRVSVIVVENTEKQERLPKIIKYWKDIVGRVNRSRLVDQTQPEKEMYSCKEPVICENNRINKAVTIKWNGDIVLCCHDIGNYVIDNVKDNSIIEIFNSQKFLDIRRSMNSGRNYPKLCDYCRGIS